MSKEIEQGSLAINNFFLEQRRISPTNPNTERIIRDVKKRLGEFAVVTDTDGERLKGAIFNQRLALDLYQMMIDVQNGKDNLHNQTTRMLVRFLREFSQSDFPQIPLLKRVLYGARAQAGLMFAFRKNNFWVIPPATEKEIMIMDLPGTDFAAVNEKGIIFFIQVKSLHKFLNDKGQVSENPAASFGPLFLTPRIIAETVSLVANRPKEEGYLLHRQALLSGRIRYVCLRISLPTGEEFMDPYGRITPKIERTVIQELNQAKISL